MQIGLLMHPSQTELDKSFFKTIQTDWIVKSDTRIQDHYNQDMSGVTVQGCEKDPSQMFV